MGQSGGGGGRRDRTQEAIRTDKAANDRRSRAGARPNNGTVLSRSRSDERKIGTGSTEATKTADPVSGRGPNDTVISDRDVRAGFATSKRCEEDRDWLKPPKTADPVPGRDP